MANFIFIALIVFGTTGRRKLGITIDLKGGFLQQLELYRAVLLCCDYVYITDNLSSLFVHGIKLSPRRFSAGKVLVH